MRRVVPALLPLLLAVAPFGAAHFPVGTPNPACVPNENPHDYLGSGPGRVSNGCAAMVPDGDDEFGHGTAFLPESHHGSVVCVRDELFGDDVGFFVVADDGDGVLTAEWPDVRSPRGTGCMAVGFPAGVAGGWWVVVLPPATRGHITTP